MAAAAGGGGRQWRVILRPVLETVLHNHALTRACRSRCSSTGPAASASPRSSSSASSLSGPSPRTPPPSSTSSTSPSPPPPTPPPPPRPGPSSPTQSPLPDLRLRLESTLEGLAFAAVLHGAIGSKDVLAELSRSHGLHTALSRLAGSAARRGGEGNPVPTLWASAILAASSSARGDDPTFRIGEGVATNCSMEERVYMQEVMAALRVAKEVLWMQEGWRKEAAREMNRTSRFSRPLANSATDWPCLLLNVLSAEAGAEQCGCTEEGDLRGCGDFA